MANPKRKRESYYTESYQRKQAEKNDRIYGPVKSHKKICERCGTEYIIEGREKTKKIKNSRFCSISCANHRGTGKEWENTHPSRSLGHRKKCFTEWEHKCVLCGYNKIVDVHHIDENKKNNEITNLIPLCPNHHMELHHKDYGGKIKDIISDIIYEKWDYRLTKKNRST